MRWRLRWLDQAHTHACALELQAGVLVAHTGAGPHEPFITELLQQLAQAGYAAFALDLYGAEHQTSPEENKHHMQELAGNRRVVAERAAAALHELCGMEGVSEQRIAALGFCLGGKCVMDLVRTAPPDALRLAVSFHGILDQYAPSGQDARPAARLVAYHGFQDPFVPNDAVLEFCGEMEGRGVDYEVRILGAQVMHAFMRPDKTSAEDGAAGFQYNELVADRAWRDTLGMLAAL